MRIIATSGSDEVARVFLADLGSGRLVEFVESVQPPLPREQKWVLLVSTLLGCPVGCPMCDAGGDYRGVLCADEIFSQIDFLVLRRFPDGRVPAEKFKVQFARVGEPALNPAVLDVLRGLPGRYEAPGLLPSVSTVAPRGTGDFFERLAEIKDEHYGGGRFQLQFSIHTTDAALRDRLIPVKKWGFSEIARYAERFHREGDRRVTLNFALGRDAPVDPAVMLDHFDPELFLLKFTPLNPTYGARRHGLASYIEPDEPGKRYEILDRLEEAGYRVLLSIGEREEDRIGSNCGQLLRRHLDAREKLRDGYTYPLRRIV
ncbi:MAG TPA: radical SAM protein [bacterium]|nr:radical SAM protein [bacterium]